jgi:hypothetical protein
MPEETNQADSEFMKVARWGITKCLWRGSQLPELFHIAVVWRTYDGKNFVELLI